MPWVWDSHGHQCRIQSLANQGEPVASSPHPLDIPFLPGLEEAQVHELAIREVLSQIAFQPGFDLAWGKVKVRDGDPVNGLGLTQIHLSNSTWKAAACSHFAHTERP